MPKKEITIEFLEAYEKIIENRFIEMFNHIFPDITLNNCNKYGSDHDLGGEIYDQEQRANAKIEAIDELIDYLKGD